jgi:hypothetical protein
MKKARSQIPPNELNALLLSKLPQILDALLAEIDVLHVGRVLGGRLRDAAGDHDWVGLEDDAVVDDLVDCQGHEVVVLQEGAAIG